MRGGFMLYRDLLIIGKECQTLRRRLNVRQREVGNEIGYGEKTISQFENGHNNNLYIFSWYLKHGLNTKRLSQQLLRGDIYGEKAE